MNNRITQSHSGSGDNVAGNKTAIAPVLKIDPAIEVNSIGHQLKILLSALTILSIVLGGAWKVFTYFYPNQNETINPIKIDTSDNMYTNITQNHSGSGDNIGGDKVVNNIFEQPKPYVYGQRMVYFNKPLNGAYETLFEIEIANSPELEAIDVIIKNLEVLDSNLSLFKSSERVYGNGKRVSLNIYGYRITTQQPITESSTELGVKFNN